MVSGFQIPGPPTGPDWAYSGRVELVVWAVPLLTIMFLGGIAWVGSHELDPAAPIASDKKPLEVQVVSLDWKWLFVYPEQNIAAINQLVVPVGTPVHFSLTSSGVWDSFFVPQLGQHDLHHEGHDHAAEPAGRSGGNLPRPCPRTSAATASRT